MVFQFRNKRRWEAILAAVLLGAGATWAEDAPKITLHAPQGSVVVGQWFEVSVVAAWTGDGTRFGVTPGQLEAPSWGEGGWDRVEARSTADGTEMDFVARFKAKAPGEVSLPPLHLNYTDPTETKITAPPTTVSNPAIPPAMIPGAPGANAVPAGASTPGATLGVDKVHVATQDDPPVSPIHTLQTGDTNLNVKPDRRWMYPYLFFAVMAAGVGVAGGSVWYGRRRKLAAMPKDVPLAPWHTVEEALHNARRHRLDGDFYKFYRELQRLVQFTGGEVKSEFAAKLQKRVEEVGFQNQVPTEDELEGIVKDIERALARWKEGQAA